MDRHKRKASFSPGKRRPPAQTKTIAEDTSVTSKMKVVVRVRPQTENELDQSRSLVKTINNQKLIFDPKEEVQPFYFQGKKQGRRDMLKKQNRALDFTFDRVFNAQSTNDEVFEDTTKGILSSLLEGFNCSVFVYGATGAGKTFTMLGSEGIPGITYLTMVELYRHIAAEAALRTFDVWVSYMEVYNENVRDLLKPKAATALSLRDDGNSGVNVAGLEIKVIHNADELLALLAHGNKNRTQHPTDANAESSRSHAVFQVYIRMTNRNSGEMKVVKLSMIDLAGSERASASGCKGMRFKEGANINKSLLALGNCINGLADGLKHIPYRDSKLTRILKDSLGGNCYTIMIANVSPNVNSFEDTYNTLKYATRAKKIKSKIKRNIVSIPLPASQYQAIIENLRAELDEAHLKIKRLEESATKPHVNVNEPGSSKSIDMGAKSEEILIKLLPIYEEKIRHHVKIMEQESKVQLLKYQRYLKIGDAETLGDLNLENSELLNDLEKIYSSLEKYKVQIASLKGDLEKVWVEERKNDEDLNAVVKKAQAAGLKDVDGKDMKIFELELKKVEADSEILHLHRLLSIQYDRLKYQEDFSKKVSKAATSYYCVLDGMNKVTRQMKEEYLNLRQMALMSKKVRWGQAHTKEHQSPSGDCLPLRIPPKIEEFSVLPFARFDPSTPGNPNNISQLNGSKKSVTSSPSTSRFMNHYETLEEFVRDTVGDDRLGLYFPSVGSDQDRARHFDFEQAFSPVLPVSDCLNKTISISNSEHTSSPPKRAALNATFDCGITESVSTKKACLVGSENKKKAPNPENLNGTFVLHNLKPKGPLLNEPQTKKSALKRPLINLPPVASNKENNKESKFKAPSAGLWRTLRQPGPEVPKAPKLISPRYKNGAIPPTPNPIRTPLRTVNNKNMPTLLVTKPKKPLTVTDVPRQTSATCKTNKARRSPVATHAKRV